MVLAAGVAEAMEYDRRSDVWRDADAGGSS
jgi:hypothetical protein